MVTQLQQANARMFGQLYYRLTPHTYAHFVSAGKWQPARHLVHIGKVIAKAVAQGSGRVIISIPPRHGKSILASFWTPIWFLDQFPAESVIITSHTASLATEWGRKIRNELVTNPLCITGLTEDTRAIGSKAAGHWDTAEGGGLLAAGVGGAITGHGFNLGILDDPYKDFQQATSALYNRRLIEWFDSTFYTRAEPNATIVVIMARWDENDLVNYLLTKHHDDWDYICLRATAEADDPLGRAFGEPLWPERISVDDLRLERNPMVRASLYQQRPMSLGSGRCYYCYDVDNLDRSLELRNDLSLQVAADFNSRPHMHLEIGQYDEYADLLTTVHEIADPKYRSSRNAGFALAQWIKAHGGWRWPELHLFGDATGRHAGRNVATGESDWRVFVQAVESKLPGLTIRRRVPSSNPAVADRLNAVNEALRDVEDESHWKIHPRCEALVTDLKEMRTDESGLPDKSDFMRSHASDADGYRIHRLRPVRSRVTSAGTASVGITQRRMT